MRVEKEQRRERLILRVRRHVAAQRQILEKVPHLRLAVAIESPVRLRDRPETAPPIADNSARVARSNGVRAVPAAFAQSLATRFPLPERRAPPAPPSFRFECGTRGTQSPFSASHRHPSTPVKRSLQPGVPAQSPTSRSAVPHDRGFHVFGRQKIQIELVASPAAAVSKKLLNIASKPTVPVKRKARGMARQKPFHPSCHQMFRIPFVPFAVAIPTSLCQSRIENSSRPRSSCTGTMSAFVKSHPSSILDDSRYNQL